MSIVTYSSTNEANLMKVKYGKFIEKQFNTENVLFGRIKKNESFVGSQVEIPVIQSIGGGVGAGSLPTANLNKIGKATITTKKAYAVVSIDRETMKASKTDEGSFVRFTKFPVKIATKSFNRNLERQLTAGDATGSGLLVSGDGATAISGAGTTGNPYILTLASGSLIASLEEGDYINVSNALSEVKEVVSIDEDALEVGLVNIVGATAPTALSADSLYMQNSKDQEIAGLKGILEATSGTHHGLAIGRRWKATQVNAAAAALSTDLMNDVVINMKKSCGESPNMILTSYKQYIKFLNLLEDAKRYNLPAKDKNFKGNVSFAGVEYISPDGIISVHTSRFVADDDMYFLNDKHMSLECRPGGFEWFDEDGTVFLRESGDSYEARYGGYFNFFVNPHFQGILQNLA